jgi:hypothetical protein
MAKKALGIEIKNFLKDGFPEGFILDFDDSPNSGELDLDNLEDNKFYELSSDNFGFLVDENGGCKTFFQAFSAWQRKKKVSYLLVEVPAGMEETAKGKITELGYKVKK